MIAIVKLLHWSKVELNQELRGILEKDMYKDWIQEKVAEVIKELTS